MAECRDLIELAEEYNRTLFAAWHSRFAGGVEPAREWLSSRTLRNVAITWHESVKKWHPGQSWIWQDGGFGVFDTGINALSIVTRLLPERLRLISSVLTTAEGHAMPVAAKLDLMAGAIPVQASFDWRAEGPEVWEMAIDSDDGRLLLSQSGASLTIDGQRQDYPLREYPDLYDRFRRLITESKSDCDLDPLELVLEALA
jgi:predicted dehydrogenase